MKKIIVIGEILVEIMADHTGDGFLEPTALTGPFASGAPAIFIDQVARLGQPCGIISAVGMDDFGQINLTRLHADGVDISAVAIDPNRPTGSAFVRYRTNGDRDFIFNIAHAACGHIRMTTEAQALLDTGDHLHVMGSSLSSAHSVDMNLTAAREIKARGGTVSFDPNLRKEMLATRGLRAAMHQIAGLCDLFLPSGNEVTLLTQATETQGAINELLAMGITAIVHKQGAQGAVYHDASGSLSAPAFQVQEVDPTGAGDCFGGAFTTCWLRGTDPAQALRVATAAGALAVQRRGPMEGTSDTDTITTFIQNHKETN